MVKRSGLGKGLESLIGEADHEANVNVPTNMVDIKLIRTYKGQPRKNFDEEALDELADSIKQNGILQPILVRKKGQFYEIVAGERRYQAAKKAGCKDIPVIVREIPDSEVFKLALIENLQRENLDPLEEALGYKKLIDEGNLTQEQLGKILSKSRSAIANTLRLLDLPLEIQNMLSEGLLSAGHARALLAVSGEDARLRLADKIIKENLSVRQTENLVSLFSGAENTARGKRTPTPQAFKRAAHQLRLALNLKVRVKRIKEKNHIDIEFKDEEELARLVLLINKAALEQEDDHEDA